MPNFAVALKDEIRRLARKEARAQSAGVSRAVARHRRDVADLKRQVAGLRRTTAFLEAQERQRVAGGPRAPAPAPKARFSTKWLAAHRRRLKFSAGDYALLLGVCGHSVYLWERGEAKPRQEQVARFHAIRGLKRREALARLEILRVAAAARTPAARGGRRRGGRGRGGKGRRRPR